MTKLEPPLELAGRRFTSGCELRVRTLAPMGEGTELAPLVRRLEVFPDQRSWPVRMRRALVPLPARDAKTLRASLRATAGTPSAARSTYVI